MKVVCIDNVNIFGEDVNDSKIPLTKGKTYEVLNSDLYLLLYQIKNDNGNLQHYLKTRFVEIREYRKQKLERINEG